MIFLLNNRNICAKISLLCVSVISVILTVDYTYQLMPFNTVFLLLYVIVVLFVTIWISFVTFQHVLNQNKPFTFDDNSYAKIVRQLFGEIGSSIGVAKSDVDIDTRIDGFVRDVERLFIRKWYAAYVSDDETFLEETRALLDIVVRRFLQIGQQINSDKIVHGVLIVLLKHVKEYRKAARKVRNGGGSIEKVYRYSHIGSKSPKALEHFTLQLTSKLLRHFVNWELFNSLACRCVTAVLAKKLVTYVIVYVSAPGFINYKLLSRCISDEQRTRFELDKYVYISISDVDHSEVLERDESSSRLSLQKQDSSEKEEVDAVDGLGAVNQVLEEEGEGAKEAEVVEVPEQSTTPIDAVTERVMSEPVKIHESRSANKTWRHSRDLDCISLGHDILYLSDMTDDKKLWKSNSDSLEAEEAKPLPVLREVVQEESEPITIHTEHSKAHNTSNIPNFLRPTTTGAATLITNTIKPIGNATAHTMKEIQKSTANNVAKVSQATSDAMHKIGDLQDEAAGVVEGIFDFGMAGIRKGLRLTGLQDDIHESINPKSRIESAKQDIPMKSEKQRLLKLGHVNSDEVKHEEIKKEDSWEDSVWVNPLVQNESSPGFEGDILLEKSPVIDSRSFSSESKSSDIPTMEIIPAEESPDPIEYEDTTDLATTTAKLRSLLAQKTSESAINTPVASPMSMVPTPLDPSGSSIEELSEVDGAINSMYKSWARTATGVFQNTLNTIKTALPGTVTDQDASVTSTATLRPAGLDIGGKKWLFVQADPQPTDLSVHMEKFLAERRVFCTIDNAYEAMETIEMPDQMDSSLISQRQFDDELDDFDTTIPMTKALVDLVCELIEDTYPPLVKENIIKVLLLVTGKFVEDGLHDVAEKIPKILNNGIDKLPKFDPNQLTLPMKIDEMLEMCLNIVPGVLNKLLNHKSTREIFKLFLESLQSHKINQDTSLQLAELLASEIITAAGQSSPTYSA